MTCAKAKPVLMEPIMKLEVVTPEENMGDVIGDLNKRRGQVEGMEEARSGARVVKGSVVVFESTVHPGVTEDVCVPILERESGRRNAGDDVSNRGL